MALIEGFEDLAGSPLLPVDGIWVQNADAGLTIAGSSSNVTQGSQSYRASGTGTGGQWLVQKNGNDLTGVGIIYIDVTITTNSDSAYAELNINQGKNVASDVTLAGETGSFTLEADISGFTGFTSVVIALYIRDVSSSDVDVYWDNLRDDAGAGGALTVMDVTDPASVMGSTYASVMGVST